MTRGDELTVAHLLEFLHARGHSVDLVTLDAGQALDPAHRAWLESRCRRLADPSAGAAAQRLVGGRRGACRPAAADRLVPQRRPAAGGGRGPGGRTLRRRLRLLHPQCGDPAPRAAPAAGRPGHLPGAAAVAISQHEKARRDHRQPAAAAGVRAREPADPALRGEDLARLHAYRADRAERPRGGARGLPRRGRGPRSTTLCSGRTASTPSSSRRGPTCRSSPTASCCPAPCAMPPTPRPPCGSPARPGRGSGRAAGGTALSGRPRSAAGGQGAGRPGRHHGHRHRAGPGRLDGQGRRLRGADPRRGRAAEQAARISGDGQGRGGDPGRQRRHRRFARPRPRHRRRARIPRPRPCWPCWPTRSVPPLWARPVAASSSRAGPGKPISTSSRRPSWRPRTIGSGPAGRR